MSGSRIGRMLALAIVTTSMLAAASCSSSSTESSGAGTSIEEGTPEQGGKLVFGLTAETNGWNPTLDQWTVDSHLVASSFYEPLVAVGPDYNLVPQLAEVIQPNDDYTQWTLHLRDGVMFHDGTPCDAEAVKANLEASRNGIGALGLKIIDSIEAVDPRTVVISMNAPWSAFPGAIAGQAGYMAAPRTLADGSASTRPVGTGPYVFSEWVPDRSLGVTKNANYWQPDLPYLDEIEYQPMIDNITRSAALESGSIDMMLTNVAQDAAKYRDDAAYTVITDDTAEEMHVTLNFSKPPFDNDLARQAVVHATNQAAVIDVVGPGVLEAADGPFAPGEPWSTSDSHYGGFDPEAAAREVTEYEAQTGQSLSFALMTFPDDVSVRQAQLLQEQWTRVGIDVRLESLEQSAYISRIVVGDFDAAMSSNFGYADPDFNFIFWHSSLVAPPGELSLNFLHNANPQIDAALEAARLTVDVDARATQYQTVTQLLNDDFAYIWLYRTPLTIVANSDVGGLSTLGDAGFARADGKPWIARLWLPS